MESYGFRLAERVVVSIAMVVFSVITWQAKNAISQLSSHEERIDKIDTWIAVTEGNRFTSNDGMELQKSISQLMAMVPDRYPPSDWLDNVYSRDITETKADLSEIKVTIKEISTRMHVVERNLINGGSYDPPPN